MQEIPDPELYEDIVDQIEGSVDLEELAQGDPEALDRYHRYQMALRDAGVDEFSLSVNTRRTLRQIIVFPPDLFDRVLDTITGAKVRRDAPGGATEE